MKHDIMRIDMIRYFILHKYGGFYIDMDMFILERLDPLQNRALLLHNVRHVRSAFSYIENDLMASVPGLGFWKTVMAEVKRSVEEKDKNAIYEVWKGRYILHTTGPYMLARVVKNYYPKFKPVHVVRTKWDKPHLKYKAYLQDYKTGSWSLGIVENKGFLDKSLYGNFNHKDHESKEPSHRPNL